MLKFRIIFWKNIPERTSIIDETNFYPNYFIGLNGVLYENYGTVEKPIFEVVFDSDYEIEVVGL